MSPYLTIDGRAWQESWDRQQEAYLPDREHRYATMLDVVEAVLGPAPADRGPRVLDLAGGTGSISLRALARFPDADVTLLDVDPALLAIATASLSRPRSGPTARIVSADLAVPGWVEALPQRGYDAVLTATALHWLPADRLTDLYAEIRGVLRPGGVLVNADHMPDAGLPGLTGRLDAAAGARRTARYAAGAAMSWADWWRHAAAVAELAPLVEQRNRRFPGGHSADWHPPASWHVDALRAAGFAEAGVVWRGGTDAAVAGVTAPG